MFAGKQFDIVMGVDIHLIQPPGPVPPVPIPHPFIGMVYDPFEFIPFIGATNLVNGLPRAQAGTNVVATIPHIPLGGVFVKPPSNDGEIYMGSKSASAEGEPFSFMGCPVLTCQDVGMVSVVRFNRKSKAKPKSLVLPTSTLISIPKGGMNLTPNPMTISLTLLLSTSVLYLISKLKNTKKIQKILDKAKKGKGNFGLGKANHSTAMKAGEIWVGKGYRIASDNKTLVSADGLRQFRPPSFKPKLRIFQANFESRDINSGTWIRNGHLDVF